MIGIGDSVSNLASSDDEEDGGDEDDEDIELRKLSEDDEHGWVVGTVFTMVPQRIGRFWQMQKNLEKLTQLAWGHTAIYLGETDKMYRTTEWKVPAVVNRQMKHVTATPALTNCVELITYLDIIPGKS